MDDLKKSQEFPKVIQDQIKVTMIPYCLNLNKSMYN